MNLFPVFLHLLYLALPTFAAETSYVILALPEGSIGRIKFESGDTVEMLKVGLPQTPECVNTDSIKDIFTRFETTVMQWQQSPVLLATSSIKSTDGFFLWKGPKGTITIGRKKSDGAWIELPPYEISYDVSLIHFYELVDQINANKGVFRESVLNSNGTTDDPSTKWLLDWMDTTNNGP
eukprot:GHVS01004313.1.p1 GENE.GHVS01004313.1~~GHVS01004313.1.p1  ORF type:complete len:179 (+),score=9.46 GHVS01004313.1:280-816(+)